MAQKVAVTYRDDIDGTKAAETVSFALDGASYEIDLSARNAKALRKALAEFQSAGRRVGSSSRRAGSARGRSAGSAKTRGADSTTPRQGGETGRRRPSRRAAAGASSSEIRAWATDNGIAVSSRGRIPDQVREQFEAARS